LPSLRNLLHERTAPDHQALEATPVMRAFSGGNPSIGEYVDYLSRQRSLHAPLEAALSRWLPPDWVDLRLRKSSWLLHDLRMLGAPGDAPDVEVPSIGSWAEALGVLYVLEGGTLGLQVVRKRLQADHPALHAAGSFLHGYGPDTGRHWRGFVQVLEELPPAEWPAAVGAARSTFASFLNLYGDAPDDGSGDGQPGAPPPPGLSSAPR
jgi:heme oxygenase